MGKIIDGKAIAAGLYDQMRQEVEQMEVQYGRRPGLTVIIVGEDPASQVYVRNKEVNAKKVGLVSEVIRLPEQTTQDELLAVIARLNADPTIDGILVQLPVPKHIDKDAVIASMLICEMAAYYRSIGSSIKQRLEEIYAQYGRYLNKVDSFEFPGLTGMDKMASIMKGLRETPPADFGGVAVSGVTDYSEPEETGLPKANVLIYKLDDGSTVIVRPSGTEPKIKTYFTTKGKDLAESSDKKSLLAKALKPFLS